LTALRSDGDHLFVIVGIYSRGPITVVPCRTQKMPLLRASILFRPHHQSPCRNGLTVGPPSDCGSHGGGAGYRPRVRCAYSAPPF